MKSVVKNSIEYSGITDNLPKNPTIFKQFTICENLVFPNEKPDIDQLIKVKVKVNVINTKAIQSPVSTSLEGYALSGWKLITEGELNIKIEYVAKLSDSPVHVIHFDVPYSDCIVLPSHFKLGTCVNVTGYIEDIYSKKLDTRSIFISIITILNESLL